MEIWEILHLQSLWLDVVLIAVKGWHPKIMMDMQFATCAGERIDLSRTDVTCVRSGRTREGISLLSINRV